VKKIGIYLGYPPGTVFSGEGLGRVLVALLQGASETGRVQFVIACPSWSRDPLSQLLREAGVATSAVAFLSPAGRPALFRLADWLQHRRLEKRKRLTGRKKRHPIDSSPKPNIPRAIIGTILSSRAGGPLAVLICLTLPLLGVGWIIQGGLSLLKRLWRRLSAASTACIQSLLVSCGRAVERLSTSSLIYDAEIRRVQRLIRACDDIHCWYAPTAFWPEFNAIAGTRVVCVPDFVVSVCPVAFAQLGEHFQRTVAKIERVIGQADHYITYSRHIRDEVLVKRFGITSDRVTVVPHGTNRLDRVLSMNTGETDAARRHLFEQVLNHGSHCDGSRPPVGANSSEPFLFYASQVRPHKNIGTLIRAYHLLRRNYQAEQKLALTCSVADSPRLAELVRSLDLQRDVLFLERLTDVQLAACYWQADLAVNPSLSEGACPFTLTEALSVGTPVVMGRLAVTAELILEPRLRDTMLFDPYDWRDMARVIHWGLINRHELLAMQKPLYDHLACRGWREAADDYLRVLEHAAQKKPVGGSGRSDH
jgi:glycosyltransferase involved in cell wall biosynthesis